MHTPIILHIHTFINFHACNVGDLIIKTLSGKAITLAVSTFDTIKKIKTKIKEKEGIPFEQQRLIFAEKTMEDGHTLRELNINCGDILHLVLDSGGNCMDKYMTLCS